MALEINTSKNSYPIPGTEGASLEPITSTYNLDPLLNSILMAANGPGWNGKNIARPLIEPPPAIRPVDVSQAIRDFGVQSLPDNDQTVVPNRWDTSEEGPEFTEILNRVKASREHPSELPPLPPSAQVFWAQEDAGRQGPKDPRTYEEIQADLRENRKARRQQPAREPLPTLDQFDTPPVQVSPYAGMEISEIIQTLDPKRWNGRDSLPSEPEDPQPKQRDVVADFLAQPTRPRW